MSSANNSQSIGWLVAGVLLGLAGVLISLLKPTWQALPGAGAIAVVNDQVISRAKYEAYLEALRTDGRRPLKDQSVAYILQRIIEEELLVQRGVEVGLLEKDQRTRAALVDAMITMTTTAAEARAPSETELAAFFQDNIDYFTPTARLRVRQLGTTTAVQVPNALLPPNKLREYLGPSLTSELMAQPVGYITRPQDPSSESPVVELMEKEAGRVPSLEEVREQVEAEYVRRAGDRALRDYLEWLTSRSSITFLQGPQT